MRPPVRMGDLLGRDLRIFAICCSPRAHCGSTGLHSRRANSGSEGCLARREPHEETKAMTACECHGNLGLGPTAVSDTVLATLKTISIPTISMTLRRLGVSGTFLAGVTPRTPQQSFAGRAFTGRTVPTRSDVARAQAGGGSLHRRAFETIPPGDVLV